MKIMGATFFKFTYVIGALNKGRSKSDKLSLTYEENSPEQIKIIEDFVCSGVLFQYYEEIYRSKRDDSQNYINRTEFNSTCMPFKFSDKYYRVLHYLAIPGYGDKMEGQKTKYLLKKSESVYTYLNGKWDGVLEDNITNMTLKDSISYSSGLIFKYNKSLQG